MMLQILVLVLPLIFLALILQAMPLLTRRGIFFSATVDPGFPQSADGRRLLRSYRWQVALWSVAAVLLALLLIAEHPLIASMAPLFGLMAVVGFIYWRKFREVHTHYGDRRAEIRQASLESPAPVESINVWTALLPFVVLVATALYLYAHWNQIPQRFPVHWGADGQPNRWSMRDWQGVYAPLMMGAGMNVLLLGFAWVLAHQTRKTVMRRITIRVIEFVIYLTTLSFVVVALLPLISIPVWLLPMVMFVSVAGLIYWSYRQLTATTAEDTLPEPQRDSYWKAGVFYWNPNDPAIFVAKRVGIGYTMNFANKWAWVALFGILLIAVLPALLAGSK